MPHMTYEQRYQRDLARARNRARNTLTTLYLVKEKSYNPQNQILTPKQYKHSDPKQWAEITRVLPTGATCPVILPCDSDNYPEVPKL